MVDSVKDRLLKVAVVTSAELWIQSVKLVIIFPWFNILYAFASRALRNFIY